MIITFKEGHKFHLSFLFTQSSNVLQEFCKLALEFLSKGPNVKLYQTAAQKLSINTEVIQNAVEGLVNLLIECCKNQLNPLDLRDTILTVGFNEEQCEILEAFYSSREKELKEVLAERTVDYPKFKDLEWRLEAQVASRALMDQMTPQVMMKLSLESGSNTENIFLQSDATNLIHMTEVLETALAESKSQHFRRIHRRFK